MRQGLYIALALLACGCNPAPPGPSSRPQPETPAAVAPQRPTELASAADPDAPWCVRATTRGAEAEPRSRDQRTFDDQGRTTSEIREQRNDRGEWDVISRDVVTFPNPETQLTVRDRGEGTDHVSRTVATLDSAGRPAQQIMESATGEVRQVTTTRYNEEGNTTFELVRSGDGTIRRRWEWHYDAAGRLVGRLNANRGRARTEDASYIMLLTRERLAYDERGQLIGETRETWNERVPDDGHRLITVEYDAQGLETGRSERVGGDVVAITSLERDGGRQVASRVRSDAQGGEVERIDYEYDAEGHVTLQTTRRPDRTPSTQRFTYDSAGRIASIEYGPQPRYWVEHQHRFEGGRVVETAFVRFAEDGDRRPLFVHRFSYDADGYLTQKSDVRDDRVQRAWTYHYDEAGLLVMETCDGCDPVSPFFDGRPDDLIQYEYAEDGRLLVERHHGSPPGQRVETTHRFDGERRVETLNRTSTGSRPPVTTRISYQYDGTHDEPSVTTRLGPDGGVSWIQTETRDESGRRLSLERRDGSGTLMDHGEWTYDEVGRTTEWTRTEVIAQNQSELRTTYDYSCWDPDPAAQP